MNLQLLEIPSGVRGTARTIRQMQKMVWSGKTDPQVLKLVAAIIKNAGTKARDHVGEVRAISNWIKANINYLWDPHGVELLFSPKQILARGAGDCDCLSTLFNAMAEAVGLRTAFVTIKDPNYPDQYSHVYSKVYIPEVGSWVAIDLSNREQDIGWEHQRATIENNIKVWQGSKR